MELLGIFLVIASVISLFIGKVDLAVYLLITGIWCIEKNSWND